MREAQEEKIKDILQNIKVWGRILDIGSGPGFLGRFLDGLFCIDIDKENLKAAPGFKVLASGDFLPFKSGRFDFLFCIDVFHLLNNPNEMKRVLSPSGTAIISIFCNEYNKEFKLKELKSKLKDWNIEREFFAGKKELTAVIFARV
jgi:SAM-dependent methyltransferase